MKRLILFDLDNTLFNPGSFRAYLFPKIAEIVGSKNKKETIRLCQKVYDQQVKVVGFFDPERFVDALLSHLKKGDKKTLLRIIFQEDMLSHYLHKEAVEIVEKLKNCAEIGILSQGQERFQRAKLASIVHFFHPDHIHIPENKKEKMRDILTMYQEYKIIFVDDMLPMLFEAKKIRPDIKTVWIKRGRYALSQQSIDGFVPDATITTLEELEQKVWH